MAVKVTRPVMRYPGGKWRMAKWIISHFPAHVCYVEPYGGAASVLMRKAPVDVEVYNDLNSEIVNVFRVLRDPVRAAELERLMRLTPFAYDEYREAYDPCDDTVEWARRVIFRSFASIGSDGVTRRNSGFRVLKNRERNGSVAAEWTGMAGEVGSFVERLRNVVIENRPAPHIIRLYDRPYTLFYIDPPYLPNTRSDSSVVYAMETTEADHIALAALLHSLQGMVVLSGYPSPLYEGLYGGWRTVTRKTNAQNGGGRLEQLWFSPNVNLNRLF